MGSIPSACIFLWESPRNKWNATALTRCHCRKGLNDVLEALEAEVHSCRSFRWIGYWKYTSVASWYTPWQTNRRQLKHLNANIQSGHSRKPSTECDPMHVVKSRVMCIWKWLKHIKTAWASDRLIFSDLPNLSFIFDIVSYSSVEVSQMSWRFHVRTAGCGLTPYWGARAEWFHACAGHVSGCHVPLDQGTMIRSCELCPLRPFHRGFFRTVSPGISRVTSRFYFSVFFFILVLYDSPSIYFKSFFAVVHSIVLNVYKDYLLLQYSCFIAHSKLRWFVFVIWNSGIPPIWITWHT